MEEIHQRLCLKIKDIMKKTDKKWLEKGTQYYNEKHFEKMQLFCTFR